MDESFGNNGKVNLSELLGESDSLRYYFRDFDILSDGKIAVGGLINEGDIRVNNYVGVCQLNPDGKLNLEFGNNGLVKLYKLNSYLETSPIWDGCGKIRIANNDKIIVSVVDREESTDYFASLFRLDSDGTYDNSFGINGTF